MSDRPAMPHASRWIEAKYKGRCADCQSRILEGDNILFDFTAKTALCFACGNGIQGPAANEQDEE